MQVTLYGLKNCDSCRKASQWLNQAGIEFDFADIRQDSVATARLPGWLASTSWDALLNRRSRTWRELPAAEHEAIDAANAQRLMQAQPTLIKRPVLEYPGGLAIGFSAKQYAATFADAN